MIKFTFECKKCGKELNTTVNSPAYADIVEGEDTMSMNNMLLNGYHVVCGKCKTSYQLRGGFEIKIKPVEVTYVEG